MILKRCFGGQRIHLLCEARGSAVYPCEWLPIQKLKLKHILLNRQRRRAVAQHRRIPSYAFAAVVLAKVVKVLLAFAAVVFATVVKVLLAYHTHSLFSHFFHE